MSRGALTYRLVCVEVTNLDVGLTVYAIIKNDAAKAEPALTIASDASGTVCSSVGNRVELYNSSSTRAIMVRYRVVLKL